MSRKVYDTVIVGAGLAGLTAAYYLKKMRPEASVLVLERSGTAGGLTGNWTDHRLGSDKKFQPPMHMIFREKYPNILKLVEEIGGTLSPLYKGYDIITSDERVHRLEMDDWTSRNLPPPLHGLGMYAKLRIPILAKWDLFKLACVSTYCAKAMIHGLPEPGLIPNTVSLEELENVLHIGRYTRDFIESVTPSIYNLHPWYTSAPRMCAVIAGTMMLNKDSLHYHVFGKNYNAAFIDKFVDALKAMGVEFKFWAEVRRLESDSGGTRVDSIRYKTCDPEISDSRRYICDNCGAENYCRDRAFCTRCGKNTTLDKIREGMIEKPVGSDLWADPEDCENVGCGDLVTAMYPHMIAALVPKDSPLRNHPYVRSCFSSRGNRTELSIARVYYKEQVSGQQMFITGTHNPTFCFNGCQSVYNNFGGDDLGHSGDVIDALLDVGIIRDSHPASVQTRRIIQDIGRVYPGAHPNLVEHISFADMYPEVLYLSEQPAISGLHRFFNTHRTGVGNWYVAGCHSGLIGIGMESAVEGAMATVNCILEDHKVEEKVPIEPYAVHAGSHVAAFLGKYILLWKRNFQSLRRMSGSRYSMPE